MWVVLIALYINSSKDSFSGAGRLFSKTRSSRRRSFTYLKQIGVWNELFLLGLDERIRIFDDLNKSILIGTEESSIIHASQPESILHGVYFSELFEERE